MEQISRGKRLERGGGATVDGHPGRDIIFSLPCFFLP